MEGGGEREREKGKWGKDNETEEEKSGSEYFILLYLNNQVIKFLGVFPHDLPAPPPASTPNPPIFL